ncbi:MAG: penicillin-binding transpeptidase domain-containing protein [Pasteurellaceae bacterium]|nr:penicillin-binding transpeptidase domain-containing protein [Pasteurellaceae bacterium]
MKKHIKPKPKVSTARKPENKALKSYIPSRFILVYLFVVVLSAALLAQSADLQVTRANEMIERANQYSLRKVNLPSTRGDILDRNGRILSTSVPMYSVTIDPRRYFSSKLNRDKARWQALAKDIGGSTSKITSNVNKFITQKINAKKKEDREKYNPRAIFNLESEDYWRLLASTTAVNYDVLLSKVRYSPYSEFLKLEEEAIQLEKNKLALLAESLNLKYQALLEKLYLSSEKSLIYLARHQSETIAEFLIGGILPKEEANLNEYKGLGIDGLILRKEFRRFYPLGEEVAQLIGFTNLDDKGAEGLEKSFDALLVGRNGNKVIRKDAKGNIIENIREEKQYNPQNIMLSIDEDLQSMAYHEIKKAVSETKAESGTAVLVDVQTGEILAMANAPSYNPNNRNEFNVELAANRAITDTFEPGSTVKPFVVISALQNKVTYLDEVLNTQPFTANGKLIQDPSYYEKLTLTGVIQKSSNTGVSRLALRMSPEALLETYDNVGFGKETRLGLGESKGRKGDRNKVLSDIERATLSYGYGLSVTPLQLARAYATLGSFGIYRPLSITKVDPPVIGERVLPEKITRDVVKMMETVAEKGGTGTRAAVEGFHVAVKTGTAQKTKTIKDQNGKPKTIYTDKHLAYTAGIAPASNPQFALVVLINDPKVANYYGGAVAGPIFSKIMGYTLKARNIKPDNIIDGRQVIRLTKPQAVN